LLILVLNKTQVSLLIFSYQTQTVFKTSPTSISSTRWKVTYLY